MHKKLSKAELLSKMSLRQVVCPFRKLTVKLLHKAMAGDEKSARQLKILQQHKYNLRRA